MMTQTVQQTAVATLVAFCACVSATPQPVVAVPEVFYASQSGRSTLDEGEGGGNPFASALIELLERPSLTHAELQSDLLALTQEKSHGFQTPDVPTALDSSHWRLKPVPASARRVALVFVYSNYRTAGVTSLPGAERDLERVAAGLRKAGFKVQTAAKPTRANLLKALKALSIKSEDAEAAVIYLTSHGFEHDGRVYLMPSDYPFGEGPN